MTTKLSCVYFGPCWLRVTLKKDRLPHYLISKQLWVTRDQTMSSFRPLDRQKYLHLNPTKWLSQAMWLQNTCHASVILHNLIERKSCDKVDSGYTQSESNETHVHVKYFVFVWPGYNFLYLTLACWWEGGRCRSWLCVFKFNCPLYSQKAWASCGFQ